MKDDKIIPIPVYWSDFADQAYMEILEKLLEGGFYNYAKKVDDATVDCIDMIGRYPDIYPVVEEFNVHRAVILNDYILTYQILEHSIEIVDFVYSGSNHPYG